MNGPNKIKYQFRIQLNIEEKEGNESLEELLNSWDHQDYKACLYAFVELVAGGMVRSQTIKHPSSVDRPDIQDSDLASYANDLRRDIMLAQGFRPRIKHNHSDTIYQEIMDSLWAKDTLAAPTLPPSSSSPPSSPSSSSSSSTRQRPFQQQSLTFSNFFQAYALYLQPTLRSVVILTIRELVKAFSRLGIDETKTSNFLLLSILSDQIHAATLAKAITLQMVTSERLTDYRGQSNLSIQIAAMDFQSAIKNLFQTVMNIFNITKSSYRKIRNIKQEKEEEEEEEEELEEEVEEVAAAGSGTKAEPIPALE